MKQNLFLLLLCVIAVLFSCKNGGKDNPYPTPDPTSIAVSDVAHRSAGILGLGDSARLTAIIMPENGDSRSFAWGSSKGSITAPSNEVWPMTAMGGGKNDTCVVGVMPVMTVSVSSEALVRGNEGGAAFLIDGNMDICWHSRWAQPVAGYPHWAQ